MSELTAEWFAEHPTPRMVAAERRREWRWLIERSSLGTPGIQALRKYGRGEELTPGEAEAMAAETKRLTGELKL